jgi:site-specific DNA recombinase
VIYLRVSTPGQMKKARDPEGYSIPAQRDACRRYAEGLGATVVTEYVEAGKTGTNMRGRPALQRMLGELPELQPDYVIFYDLSRVARDDFDALWLLREIERHGCKLESTLERVDDTPAGKLLYTVMAGVNAFRSRGDAVKIKEGLGRKHSQGGTPFRAPIGYLNTPEIVCDHVVRTIGLDPERAIRAVRHWRLRLVGAGRHLGGSGPAQSAAGRPAGPRAGRQPAGRAAAQRVLHRLGALRRQGARR